MSLTETEIAELIKRLEAAERVIRIAEQLAEVASDWNLDEVEIDGGMRDIYEVRDIFRDWLARHATGQVAVGPAISEQIATGQRKGGDDGK